jgi:Ni,Fe-hydrogenase maturation factor
MLFSDDGIGFPVTQALSAVYNGWTLFDTATIGQLAPSIILSIPFASLLLAT